VAVRDWDDWMWRQAEELLREADRIRRGFHEAAVSARSETFLETRFFGPPVNVVVAEDAILVTVALPGVAAEEVDVAIDGRDLVVRGRREFPEPLRHGRIAAFEIPCGAFERRVRLPSDAAYRVAARCFDQGLLTIEVRRAER
jgi:HSP20 family molecular chaperone IbpA